jgi:hypothetical protein
MEIANHNQFLAIFGSVIILYTVIFIGFYWWSKHGERLRICARCTNVYHTHNMKKLSKLDWRVPGRVCLKCFEQFKKDLAYPYEVT